MCARQAGPTPASAASDWKPRNVVSGSCLPRQSGKLLLFHMSTSRLPDPTQPAIRSNIIVRFWDVVTQVCGIFRAEFVLTAVGI